MQVKVLIKQKTSRQRLERLERNKQKREYHRKWREAHPDYFARKQMEYYARHPEALAAHRVQFAETHPEYYRERHRQERLTMRVNGKQVLLLHVDKRPWTGFCELCGEVHKENLMYHHWDDECIPKGMWLYGLCHWFAELMDKGENLLEKYLALKKQMDEEYANGEIVRLAKLQGSRQIIGQRINGVRVNIEAWGKRPQPLECELRGELGCRLLYHHWDDKIPGKGIWVCNECHSFAEVADKGLGFVYLELKQQIEKEIEFSKGGF